MSQFNHSNFPQFSSDAQLAAYAVRPRNNDLVQYKNGILFYFDEEDVTSADMPGFIITQTTFSGLGRWKRIGLKAIYQETVNSGIIEQGTIKSIQYNTTNPILKNDIEDVEVTNLKELADIGLIVLNESISADGEITIVVSNQAGYDLDLSNTPIQLEIKVFQGSIANIETPFAPLNEFIFTTGTVPTLASFETAIGFPLVNGQIVGDTITFDNIGYFIPDLSFSVASIISVNMNSSVSSIGVEAFSGNQLTSITIPSNTTSIGEFAFANNLLTAVTLPVGCTYTSTSFDNGVIVTGGILI